MKILEIIYNLSSGGAERLVVDLSNQLALLGHEVILCTLIDDSKFRGDFYKEEIEPNVIYKNFLYKKLGFSCMKSIYNLVKKEEPDVVHMHLVNTPLLCILPMIFMRKVLYVATCHNLAKFDLSHSKMPIVKKMLFKWGFFKYVAISHDNLKSIDKYYGKKADALIYNGRAYTPCTNELEKVQIEIAGYKQDEDTVVYINIARCQKQKNHKRLIRCFNKMIEQGYNAILLLIGNGYDSDEGQILRSTACSKIFFLGTKHNVSDYLRCSDIFVLSSDYEGMPITLIEALANGCVPIGTPVSGIVDVVKDGENGFVSRSFSDPDFLEMLIRSYIGFRKIDRSSLKSIYMDNFSIERCAQQYLKYFANNKKDR